MNDVDGDYNRLRQQLLSPPFQPITFPPHVTLVHPRTSFRGREFWERGSYQADHQVFIVTEIAITAFDGNTWVVLEQLALGGEV